MLKYTMPVPALRITDGQMYRSTDSFAWVDYPMGSPSDEVGALTKASETQDVVQVIGAEFTIQGTVTVFSMGNGAKFRVVSSD
jgi:hypothetical protein